MTTCETIQQQLADYLGNELPPTDRAAFERHLHACPACRAEAEGLSSTLHILRAAAGSPAHAEHQTRSLDPARAVIASIAPRRTLARLATAAAILIAFTAGYFAGAPTAAPSTSPNTAITGSVPPAVSADPPLNTPTPKPARATIIPRLAQDYQRASQTAPTAGTFGWALLSTARR